MCGIVGYVGEKAATPLLLNALSKLEYRGYDSAGIAVLSGEDIVVRKAKGALAVLKERIAGEVIKGSIGIGHTRWATHGEPSDVNAHPQTNVSGTIAVVHNGIIENYADLKAELQTQGVVFRSKTDTEVIAHTVNYYYAETLDIFDAVRKAVARFEGSYALAVLCADFPDRIVCARKDSPLVVGVGKGENFIASDVPALLEHTREVHFLEQGEAAVLYADHVDLFRLSTGERIARGTTHVDWDVDAAEKGGYAHFMLKEIHEQPKALTDTLHPRLVRDGGKALDIAFSETNMEGWKNARRIIITACGTAYHAGVVAKYAFEKLARLKVDVDVSSEFRYRDPILDKDDIFIVISQSGETADTLAALRLAKSKGLRVIAITNCVGSSVSREADDVIYTWAGPEIAVASTKAYTTQLACLYLLALKAGRLRSVISDEDWNRLLAEIDDLPSKVENTLSLEPVIQRFASEQFNKDKIFFIGRQMDNATSLECALKLKEVSYMHSEAFAAGELKHGPIALVDPSTLVVAVATNSALYDKIASNIEEVRTRGAATLVITQDKKGVFDKKGGDGDIMDNANTVVELPDVCDVFAPVVSVLPAQLLAYYCAVLRGNNPDKPRNLAKSVTVE